jgi:hypothetical protein
MYVSTYEKLAFDPVTKNNTLCHEFKILEN